MIIGIGTDMVDISRIEKALARHGDRFIQRCFTAAEQEKATAREAAGLHIQTYAVRWAAKEACAKALGTGFRDGLSMLDITVVNDPQGKPILKLSGAAQERLEAIVPRGKAAALHVSFSDESSFALAFVVIEANNEFAVEL